MPPSPDGSDATPAPAPLPTTLPTTLDVRRRRILFRANHRGTYENDLLVGGYVRARIAGMTDPELDALEEVLELPDAELADWLTGRQPIPASCDTPMLRAIRDSAAAGDAVGGAIPGKAAGQGRAGQ